MVQWLIRTRAQLLQLIFYGSEGIITKRSCQYILQVASWKQGLEVCGRPEEFVVPAAGHIECMQPWVPPLSLNLPCTVPVCPPSHQSPQFGAQQKKKELFPESAPKYTWKCHSKQETKHHSYTRTSLGFFRKSVAISLILWGKCIIQPI